MTQEQPNRFATIARLLSGAAEAMKGLTRSGMGGSLPKAMTTATAAFDIRLVKNMVRLGGTGTYWLSDTDGDIVIVVSQITEH